MGPSLTLQFSALLCVLLSAAAQEDCKEPLRTFANCLKEEVHLAHTAEQAEAEKPDNAKVDKCFTDNGCTAPDWDSPVGQGKDDAKGDAKGNWQSFHTWWHSLDNEKRHCVVAETRGDFKEKLQECLNAKVPGFTIPGESTDKIHVAENIKKDRTTVADRRFRIRRTLRKCGPKSGPVNICLNKNRNLEQKGSCEARKKCAAPLSPSCKKAWTESFKNPICGCVIETAGKLQKASITAKILPTQGDAVLKKCGVTPPAATVKDPKTERTLQNKIKDYVTLFEDRVIPFCHDCDGVDI